MKTRTVQELRMIVRDLIPDGIVVADHDKLGHAYKHTPTGMRSRSVTTKAGILDAPHLKPWAAKLAVEKLIEKAEKMRPYEIGIEDLKAWKDEAILAHQDTFEQAGGIGTIGHKVIEDYLDSWMETDRKPEDIRSFVQSEDPRVYAIARSAEKFFNEHSFEPVASELKVYSTKYNFSGTLDCLGVVHTVLEKGMNPIPELDTQSHVHDYWAISASKPLFVCKGCNQKTKRLFVLLDFKTSNSIDKPEYAMQVSAYDKAIREMTKNELAPEDIIILRLDKAKAFYEAVRLVDRVSAFRTFLQIAKVYDWLNNQKDKLAPLIERPVIDMNLYESPNPSGLTRV